jgi:hypothetical protein
MMSGDPKNYSPAQHPPQATELNGSSILYV